MSTEFVYTALIDVLSYRNRLNHDVQSGKESFKDDLLHSLSIFDSVNNAIFNVLIDGFDVIDVRREVAPHLHDIWSVIGRNEDIKFGNVVVETIKLRFNLNAGLFGKHVDYGQCSVMTNL